MGTGKVYTTTAEVQSEKSEYRWSRNRFGEFSGLIRVHRKPHEIKHAAAIEQARKRGREQAAKRNGKKP